MCRKNWRVEKNDRYFDLKHPKSVHNLISPIIFYNLCSVFTLRHPKPLPLENRIYIVALTLGLQRVLFYSIITSIPACRDAPCNETNCRYFEFKQYEIFERLKNFYLLLIQLYYIPPQKISNVLFPKIIIVLLLLLKFIESLFLYYNKSP